jgi:hemerythrin
MTNDLNKNQAKMVAEKTAIIANTAFKMGIETEHNRVIELLNKELTLHKRGSTGAHTIQRIIDQVKREPNVETH